MTKSLVSELSADATSEKMLSALSTGVVAAILYVIFELLFAAMIYSGSLSPLATRGAGLTLCGGFLLCLFAALTSGFKATVSMPQDAPAAVLSTMALTIAATLGEGASMDAAFMTVAAVLALSAFLTGIAFIVIGRFRLANLLRFMPFPVVGGFVAGIGFLFIVGGMAVMCGIPVSLNTLSRLAAPDMILKWLPGVAYGVVLFAITLRYSHFLILPGSLVAGMALFYMAIAVCGMSIDGAKAVGLLVSGVPADGLWPAFTLKDLTLIDWPAVRQQLPGVFAVVLVTVVGMLLNVSGIELAAGEEMDMNAEFMSGGIGNCLSGLGGCFPGYPAISLSLLGLKTGADTRLTGVVTALIVGGVLFIGGRLLEFFPKTLLGGMLLFLGFSLIHEWIVTSRKRMPLPDYLIVVSIFLVIGVFGFLQGVAFGLVAAVIFFVIRFSRVPVIKSEFTALNRRSVKERSVPHRKLLSAGGERIRGYELTGYLFFGSTTTLLESLNGALSSEPHPDFILLDMTHISGFDISAVNNFQRFALNAGAADTAVAVTAAPDCFIEAMKQSVSNKAMQNITIFQDLDRGLEWCEEKLIERLFSAKTDDASMRDALFHQSVDDFMAYLERQEHFEHLVDCLSPWLEHREYSIGSVILKKGEPVKGLYLLTCGTATENDPDTGIRMRSFVPGNVIAAVAAFDNYTAPTTIQAESDCKMVFLSLDARKLLERETPSLAIALHGFLIRSVSKRGRGHGIGSKRRI